MFGWFQALMPKEERFFTLFEKHAAIVVAGAEALRGLLQGGDSIEDYRCRRSPRQQSIHADSASTTPTRRRSCYCRRRRGSGAATRIRLR